MRMRKYQIRIVIQTVYKKTRNHPGYFNCIQDLINYFIFFQLPINQLLVLSPLDRAPHNPSEVTTHWHTPVDCTPRRGNARWDLNRNWRLAGSSKPMYWWLHLCPTGVEVACVASWRSHSEAPFGRSSLDGRKPCGTGEPTNILTPENINKDREDHLCRW